MAWLTQDALDFLAELELNNDREWFAANKKRYEASLKQPLERLAGELIERMKAFDPAIEMTPKQAVFRIHRDTRFSKDKRPYKTNAGLHVNSGGRSPSAIPGLYLHVEPRCLGLASGYYMMEPAQVAAVRRHLVANADEFARRLAEPAFVAAFKTVAGEQNKVLPPEFKDAAKAQPLIANKQFYYWAEHDPAEALRDDLPDFAMRHIEACWPMNRFLAGAFA
jgi:uncharacterized protein (TIGR02453 family)